MSSCISLCTCSHFASRACCSQTNPLLGELNRFLETAGVHDPFSKIYITTEPLSGFAALLFLFVLAQCPKLAFNPKWGALVRASKSGMAAGQIKC